jgi:DnaJ-class molecular chaperone
MADTRECERCEGTGTIQRYCGWCNGSGEGMYDGSTCRSCKGMGEMTDRCEDCDGTGEIPVDEDEESDEEEG